MTKKKTAKMKEPPIGSVVLDSSASAWQRTPNGWAIAGTDGSWFYTWEKLQKDLYVPDFEGITSTWKSVVEDAGILPRILFVPGEDLIEGQEED